MKPWYVKRGEIFGIFVAAASVCALATISPPAHAEVLAAPQPAWAGDILGRVDFKGDNKYGVITGQDFLDLSSQDSIASAIYEQRLSTHPEQLDPTRTPGELRMAYRQKLEDRRMAILILNRIIDHEAMKHKLERGVMDARVDYILRSILIQFGASSQHLKAHSRPVKKVWVMDEARTPGSPPPATCHETQALDKHGQPKTELALDEDASERSNDELYSWLKQAVGENQLHFEMDWTYADIGTYAEHDHLRDGPDLGWPMEVRKGYVQGGQRPLVRSTCSPILQEQSVEMGFDRFPATWQEFRAAIRGQLQSTYLEYMRFAVWKSLIQERNPLLNWSTMFSATDEQFDRMYEGLKDSQPIQIPHALATLNEVRAEGPKAPEFKARYTALLNKGEAAHDTEFSDADTVSTAQGAAKWLARILELRRTIPDKAYRRAVLDFASDIAAGRLRVSSAERTILQGAQPPVGSGFAATEERSAFDLGFFTSRLMAGLSGVDTDNSIKIMTLVNLESKPEYRQPTDEKVHDFLRTQIENRLKGRAFRRLAYELFSVNHFEFINNFCKDGGWPCSRADDHRFAPRYLAETLFPETLYPGQSYPAFTGSSLGHDEIFDKVQDISIDNLARVFAVPDRQ